MTIEIILSLTYPLFLNFKMNFKYFVNKFFLFRFKKKIKFKTKGNNAIHT